MLPVNVVTSFVPCHVQTPSTFSSVKPIHQASSALESKTDSVFFVFLTIFVDKTVTCTVHRIKVRELVYFYYLVLTPEIVKMVLDELVFLAGFNIDQVSILALAEILVTQNRDFTIKRKL